MTQESANATAQEVAAFRERVLRKLTYSVGKDPENASDYDWFHAVALATRDSTIDRWMDCTREAYTGGQKRVYYLSLEFLIGRLLVDSLSNLGLFEVAREALAGLDVDIDRIRLLEPDAALGNGGLGRLAACFMESMATLGVVSHGYGIRYDHGLFRQAIVDGWQHEQTETWLDFGNPWEFERSEVKYLIGFGGSVTATTNEQGEVQHFWHWAEGVRAIAYDTPIVGWRGAGVNTLRLWRARPEADFHLARFNAGDHIGAAAEEARAESISRVLYPADSTEAGQELRLRQEYFFVAASLQDLLRRHLKQRGSLDSLPEYTSIQLNDTHPAIAVAELMRLLVDVHSYEWQHAWRLTTATLSYTNHTLLPEALETWPVGLMERLLPRHMQIIYLINAYHLDNLRERGIHDAELLRSVSLIEEDHGRRVRMGNLAFLGSHSTNGVSGLHTQLMRKTVFTDLHRLYPQRINSKTNGITFRRWLYQANPQLTQLLVEHLGEEVLDEPETRLRQLEPYAEQAAFRQRFAEQRLANKRHLANVIQERLGNQCRSDRAVRRACQTHPRVQAPAAQPAAHRGAVPGHPLRSGWQLGATGEDLRRQGGGQLSPGQADHQADQRHRQYHQRRPDRARAAQGGVPAQLQRQPGRGHHSRGGSVRADFHRRARSLRHQQHEVCPQRRTDHRHPGRRQRGNERTDRP